MPIHGSCLCGAIRFEIARAVGPVEICHCNRCRKTEDFELRVHGRAGAGAASRS